jgi:hypothetical protein
MGRSFLFVHSLAGEKSQARVSAAKLRIGYALQNPWQFAAGGSCGKLRAGSALRNSGQFAAGGGCGPRLLNSTRVLVVGYIRNRHRTRHIRSFADFLLERLRF